MAALEDGEDCAMKYLKEQQKNPSGPRKTKPRCETDAAMEYLKGQLAKQKKPATGRTSPKVPLPDYLKGIRLQAAQTERSPERSTRVASNPSSPGTVEVPQVPQVPQVRDAYFSPVSDVRKTLELIQHKNSTPQSPQPQGHGPLSPQSPLEVKRSSSAKRLRPQNPPPSPLSWTTRSLRVPLPATACPSSPAPSRSPGRAVPSSREEVEVKEGERSEAPAPTAPAAPASWVKTYTDMLEKSQKSQGNARFESPVRRVAPGVASKMQAALVSPAQTWRPGRPPQPVPSVPASAPTASSAPRAMPAAVAVPAPTAVPTVPLDLSSLTSGSLRVAPAEDVNPGYHSARIVRPEEGPKDSTEPSKGEAQDVAVNEVPEVSENTSCKEMAETLLPTRPALTPCNFTGASTPNPSLKKPVEGMENKHDTKSERTPDKIWEQTEATHENRPPSENPEVSQPRLLPSGARSPAPGFFRLQRDCMKPLHAAEAGTPGPTRMQGIATCITPSPMAPISSTPPMPLTPPLPWQRTTGFELKPCMREHTAPSARATTMPNTTVVSTTQWFPPKVGVYRTVSVTAVPWFPKTEQRPWNPQQGSPLRRRQIKV